MSVKRLTRLSLLTALALILFTVELQLPALAPIPGVKLGLANIITVYAMFALGPADTAAVLLARIVLGAVFSRQPSSLLYSLAGGTLCYLAMLPCRRLLSLRQLWLCSVIGAVFHNLGQLGMAILITRTPALIGYLPILLLTGVPAGVFTGLCAQLIVNRLARPAPSGP